MRPVRLLLGALCAVAGCGTPQEASVPRTPPLPDGILVARAQPDPRSRISGRLVVAEGQDVREARVAVAAWGFDGADPRGPYVESTVPEADGNFELAVPPGEYRLLARHPSGAVQVASIPASAAVDLGELELRPVSDLRIQVRARDDGAPVPGVQVGHVDRLIAGGLRGRDTIERRLFAESMIRVPAADGEIRRVDLPPGEFQLHVEADGFLAELLTVRVDGPEPQRAQLRMRRAQLVDVRCELGVPADPDESYSMTLLEDEGRPRGGAGTLRVALPAAGGRLALRPGEYRVDVSRRGEHSGTERDVARVRVEEGQEELVVPIPRADLRVEIVDPSGPLAFARFTLSAGEGGGTRRINGRADAWGIATARLRPGPCRVSVLPDSGQEHRVEVAVAPGSSSIRVELPGGSLTGRLLGAEGRPVIGGEVRLVEDFVDAQGVPRRGPRAANTARDDGRIAGRAFACREDGSFQVSHVPAGVFWLVGTAEGCGYSYALGGPFTVAEGAVEGLEIPLVPEGRIELRCDMERAQALWDGGGEVAAFLRIDPQRTEGGRRSPLQPGVYQWGKLPRGSYTLILKAYGPRAADGSRPSQELGTWELTLDADQRSHVVRWPTDAPASGR